MKKTLLYLSVLLSNLNSFAMETIEFPSTDVVFKSFRTVWRPTGKGKHYSLSLKQGYKAPSLESLLKMPSCVTF